MLSVTRIVGPLQRMTFRETLRKLPMRFSTAFMVAKERASVSASFSLSTVSVSHALEADGTETLVCSYLSLTLLMGLGANALLGW